MFENRSKCRTLYFPILEFSTHFCPIKKVIYLATMLDRKFRLFKNSPF